MYVSRFLLYVLLLIIDLSTRTQERNVMCWLYNNDDRTYPTLYNTKNELVELVKIMECYSKVMQRGSFVSPLVPNRDVPDVFRELRSLSALFGLFEAVCFPSCRVSVCPISSAPQARF